MRTVNPIDYYHFNPFVTGVNVATTEQIPSISELRPKDYIDTVQIFQGMTVLIKDQYNASENGIYVVTKNGLELAEWNLGDLIIVQMGEQNAYSAYQCTNKYIWTKRW